MDALNEITANLVEYKQQLSQIEDLLLQYPDNTEYQELYNNLREVIQLTEDVKANTEVSNAAAVAAAEAQVIAEAGNAEASAALQERIQEASRQLITSAPALQLPSVLPPQVAQQIRAAQQKAALQGQAPPVWAIGASCQAVYSEDGQWYDATVTAVTAAGYFVVQFDGYENTEEVPVNHVRLRPDNDVGYTGVTAPKRKAVEAEPVIEEMPAWLEIKETDDEKTRQRKRKLQKSYKNKMRFHKMDLEQKQRQQSWQDFMTGKSTKKKAKAPLLKNKSIFRVPENGKVGVIGSGKGITEYKKPSRHDFQLAEEDE